jgi:hypothetical protein
MHPECIRERMRDGKSPRRASGNRGTGTAEARTLARHCQQRMQRERLVRREHVEAERSGAVTDERTRSHRRSSPDNLVVGNSEDHDVESHAVEPSTERAFHPRQRADERPTHSTVTNDGASP